MVEVIGFWLFNMDFNSLKQYEKDMLLILLNGVSDEDYKPVQEKSIEILEKYGKFVAEAEEVLESQGAKTEEIYEDEKMDTS